MSAMPADADALTLVPFRDVNADCLDASRDFMSRHPGILKPGPAAFLDEKIAVANAARLHFDANLPHAWLGDIALHQFPVSARLGDLRRLHFLTHKESPVMYQ